MSDVTIRDLRGHLDEVLARVEAGERIWITRGGQPVAELRPYRRPPMHAETLLARWRWLPALDETALRRDTDAAVDPTL